MYKITYLSVKTFFINPRFAHSLEPNLWLPLYFHRLTELVRSSYVWDPPSISTLSHLNFMKSMLNWQPCRHGACCAFRPNLWLRLCLRFAAAAAFSCCDCFSRGRAGPAWPRKTKTFWAKGLPLYSLTQTANRLLAQHTRLRHLCGRPSHSLACRLCVVA